MQMPYSKKTVMVLFCSLVAAFLMVFLLVLMVMFFISASDDVFVLDGAQNTINLETHFRYFVPPLDLRGYDLNHFVVEQWFLERINYHRENYGIHPYELYPAAVVTSIEHSLDMRDNNIGTQASSDGRTHQERHHTWFGYDRTMVTSSHVSSHNVGDGPLTQDGVVEIVDNILQTESTFSFIMNPTYYYIGVGFSIQANGRGRLNIVMASKHGQRDAHRARTMAEREEHRLQYLEKVRRKRGWQE